MNRATLSPLVALGLAGLLAAGLPGCGGEAGEALETLPPIKTTSSTTTTTNVLDGRRIFYTVMAGDYLTEIARRYQVPTQLIIDLNALTSDVIQPGQVLEIPNDVRYDSTLPPDPVTSTTAP